MPEGIPIYDAETQGAEVLAEVAVIVKSHHRLLDVLRWLGSQTPPGQPIANVAQDEFIHDIVVSIREDLLLAYEVT